MKIILIIIFILILLFLQVGILPHLTILGIYPNLILLSILSSSIVRGWKNSLIWIILGGLFMDFYSPYGFLGISVMVILVLAYLVYFFSQNIFKKATLSSVVLIFLIAVFLYELFWVIFYQIFNIGYDFEFLRFIVGIFYNLILGLPIFYLIKNYGK